MDSNRISPKEEELEPDTFIFPEPQPRVPDPTHYRDVVGPAKADGVVYKMPKDGRPYYDPIVRKPNPSSNYDEDTWPAPYQAKTKQFNKRQSHDYYLLTDDEIADLCYIVQIRDKYEHHLYLASEVEHRAWEIYGGPEGFQYAKKIHDQKMGERRRQRRASETASPLTPKKAFPRRSNGPSSPGSVTRTTHSGVRFNADPYYVPIRSSGRQASESTSPKKPKKETE